MTSLSALAIYLATLPPDVTLGFSGVFSVAGMYAGLPGPPGYPAWTIWAWVFTKILPFSNIAWRAGVASAIAGALACGIIALIISRGGAGILAAADSNQWLKPNEQKALRAVCGFSAGLTFGCNGAFWGSAVIADAWTLSILLLCLVLCLLLRWSFTPERKRYLYGAFFVFGLMLTNSQLLFAAAPAIPVVAMVGSRSVARDMFLTCGVVFLVGLVALFMDHFPSLNYYEGKFNTLLFLYLMIGLSATIMSVRLAIQTKRVLTEWQTILVCGMMLLLGLALYLYVPIASMTNPPMNWGYPRTVTGFFHVLSRGQFERIHATNDVVHFLMQVGAYLELTGKQFGWLYLPLTLVPFVFVRRFPSHERRWFFALLAVFVCSVLLILVVVNPALDWQSQELTMVFFSASYVVLAIWMGYGLVLLGPHVLALLFPREKKAH